MRSILRHAAGGALWLIIGALPVFAQADRMGGPVEFRSADRPMPEPTLRSADSESPNGSKSLTIGPPAADDVLKQIDRELGRIGTRADAEAGRSVSAAAAGEAADRRGLGGSTFK
jgi:hypothetical protein